MGKVIYSMGVSLDGYVAGRDGEIDWSAPDAELHRFHNQQLSAIGVHVLGRRLYETMRYWDMVDESALPEVEREFASIWKRLPKVVFSHTLSSVEGNARLATGELAGELARLREESDGEIAIGGARLAASAIQQGLVDELRPIVSPVVLGGGTPYLPPLARSVRLALIETRAFGSGVVYLRYGRRSGG